MKTILKILAIAVVAASFGATISAPAQQGPIYTLILTASQMQALWTIIQKVPMPREATEELAAEFLRQVRDQDEARAKKMAEPKAEPKDKSDPATGGGANKGRPK